MAEYRQAGPRCAERRSLSRSATAPSLLEAQQQGAPAAQLLSVVRHRLGLTVAQAGVDDQTKEIPLAPELLGGLVLAGRICTRDALLTQRASAQLMVEGGGDYVLVVQGKQPT